ncbi:MAG: transporter substrate-binding domain-containing protein [Rubricoccaceae bacterium]
MKKRTASLALFVLAGALALAAVATTANPGLGVDIPDPIDRDLDAIIVRDTLVALTSTNSTSYFVYRGEAFGYEYELLRDFAEAKDLELVMKVVPRDSLLYYLNTGQGDVAAARLEPVQEDTARFAFSQPLYITQPAVVQQAAPIDSVLTPASVDSLAVRVPDEIAERLDASPGDQALRPLQIRARLVRQPADLAGEEVFLPENDPYVDRLVELADEVTGDIEVVEVDTTSVSLIRQVAVGNIELTVAQQNVAELEQGYYVNLEVAPTLDEPHGIAFAVRKNAPVLRHTLDAWILGNQDSGRWATLYRKYFIDRKSYRERISTGYLAGETGTLSDYDALLKQYAPTIGWDWRLLASQMFQESRFKPRARSWAGAMGLLQLMPATAREVGVVDAYDPEDNVAGAVRYLDWLHNTYWEEKIADPEERLKFILASYNAGSGHVMDAQRLTEKNGGDPTRWEDVAFWLLQKSKPAVYNDPVVKYGYARGLEPVTYVARILERYAHYSQFVDPVEGADAVPELDAPVDA